MLSGIIFSSLGLGTGGSIGNLLAQLEQQGVFAYLLPFLMIFAVLFGILSKINIFGEGNRNINIILSIVVALMALQLNFVSYFFREIFPRMGVVLSILLVFIILLGLFFDFEKPGTKTFMGFLILIAVVIIVGQSLEVFNWIGIGSFGGRFSYWFQRYGVTAAVIIFVIVVIALITKKPLTPEERAMRATSKNNKQKMFAFPQDFIR